MPGLLWPRGGAYHPAADLALPALARLLGQGTRRFLPFQPLNAQLARLFGLEADPLPLAALRHRGEAAADQQDEADAHWLCVDPVHLSFASRQLLLSEFDPGEITLAEAHALIAALNTDFAELGQFSAASTTRWYLRLRHPDTTRFFALHDVVGRPVEQFLPEGDAGHHWRHLMNEIQIALHAHPLNLEREATGRRTINSVWPWGAGTLAAPLHAPLPTVMSSDPLVRGFALAARAQLAPPAVASALDSDTLVVLTPLLPAARQFDADTWRSTLATLETEWFAPLLAALTRRRLSRLQLLAPGDHGTLAVDLAPRPRWCLWRSPSPLALHRLSAPPPPAP
ncbi:hypothetical protein AGMMS50225_00470 [Betaproteobacteria bacterium]|nr:hypothetical protein AGMMS50225_00470 [Betaproteobacteria bacterium]